MTYGKFGFTEALELTHTEREWYLKRIIKDVKKENAEMQKIQSRSRTKRG